jgi:acetolactate synthase-1/2/3 large subunit
MNIQELQTVRRDDLPIHILIMNNQSLGMIRDYQAKMFDRRYYGTVEEFSFNNYEALAKAYGFDYLCVDEIGKYSSARDMIKKYRRSIIEVILPREMTTNPDSGAGIFKQFPYLNCEDIKRIERIILNEEV